MHTSNLDRLQDYLVPLANSNWELQLIHDELTHMSDIINSLLNTLMSGCPLDNRNVSLTLLCKARWMPYFSALQELCLKYREIIFELVEGHIDVYSVRRFFMTESASIKQLILDTQN